MKKLMITLLLCLPMAISAQDNTWEQPKAQTQQNPDQKYLAGAVPVVDGKVTFTTTISAPGKSSQQIYDIMLAKLTELAKEEGQYENSRVNLQDTEKKLIVGSYQEQLVFKRQPLSFDYTRLMYTLMVECSDGEAKVTMTRIHYLYEEEREPQNLIAEEWITDQYGLTKKGTKLARISGKFRRKTIDRKDYLFELFNNALTK
ncbi:MAG: DUF4468 domain-containing protein [Prevotella sp.]|jgi:colicin import membrane protein|nr:DUF4468 domain-containing protein [Prevotella sp.]